MGLSLIHLQVRSIGFVVLALIVFLTSFDRAELLAKGKCPEQLAQVGEVKPVAAKDLMQYLGAKLKTEFQLPTLQELADEFQVSTYQVKKLIGGPTKWLELLVSERSGDFNQMQRNLAKAYVSLSKESGVTPSFEQFQESLGVSSKNLEELLKITYGDFASLESYAAEEKNFDKIIQKELLTDERLQALNNAIAQRKRLILTTAVAGAPIDQEMFHDLLYYADQQDAEIIIYPANMRTFNLDNELLDHPKVHILTHSHQLPSTVLNRIKITAKQKNPLMGLDNLGRVIVGSPKMHVKTVASIENETNPVLQFTTGAVTKPNYAGAKIISDRTDQIAMEDHRMGAVVLEWDDRLHGGEGDYHMRHIEHMKGRGFLDVDTLYSSEGEQRANIEALVLGDIHAGETDGRVFEALPGLVKKLQPQRIVLHDLFNGQSVNHHESDQSITRTLRAQQKDLNLKEELELVGETVQELMKMAPNAEIVVVPSNHDAWLLQWLEKGEFLQNDPDNARVGITLAQGLLDFLVENSPEALEGYEKNLNGLVEFLKRNTEKPAVTDFNLLQYALEEFAGLSSEQLRFLKVGERYAVGPEDEPVELSLHGHAGPKGGRASLKNVERATARAVYGHTHTYGRRNGAVNVGTLTILDPSYARDGFSDWVHSVATVGENGEVQVFVFKDGHWFAEGNQRRNKVKPVVVPNVEPPTQEGQVDQYSGR